MLRQRGKAMSLKITIKRAYVLPAKADGYRLLVDRLWPRGLTRDAAAIDAWEKDLAPSTDLRRWFAHEPERWKEFVARYRAELASPAAAVAVARLRKLASRRKVTLVYAASDETHNNAVALRTILAPLPAKNK